MDCIEKNLINADQPQYNPLFYHWTRLLGTERIGMSNIWEVAIEDIGWQSTRWGCRFLKITHFSS